MAIPTIPALLDPTAYGVTLTPGSYESLVADTLGNTAHPSDGFDAKLAESAARHQAFLDQLPAFGLDVLALGETSKPFDAHPGADASAQFEPIAGGLDASVADYFGTVLPAPK